MVYVKAVSEIEKTKHVDGFLTFVCLEPDTKKKRIHDVVLDETSDPEELEVRERALKL